MSVTFVTAFLKLADRDPSVYISQFRKLAETGVDIRLFLDEAFEEIGRELCATYPNVHIPEYVTLEAVPTMIELPSQRTPGKDTGEYLMMQLSKLKFLARALKYTNRPYLAWIDFRVFHVFSNVSACQERIRSIEQTPPSTTRILAPGCWAPGAYPIWDSIAWRFCGGFLLAPRDRVEDAYKRQTELVTVGYPRLTWEVNYWTQMEDVFEWYRGDHNDTLLPTH